MTSTAPTSTRMHLPIHNACGSVLSVPELVSFHHQSNQGISSSHVVASVVKKNAEPVKEDAPLGTQEMDELTHGMKSVSVFISGHSFSLNAHAFQQLKSLPWKKSSSNQLTLNTDPNLFEILVHYVLFQQLPNNKTLSVHDKEELEAMASRIGMTELSTHMKARSGSFRNSFRRSSSSMILGSSKRSILSESSIPSIKASSSHDTEPTADEQDSNASWDSPKSLSSSTNNTPTNNVSEQWMKQPAAPLEKRGWFGRKVKKDIDGFWA